MAYKPYKMKGHTLPGIKQSPYKAAGIFKDVLDEETGKIEQVRISDEESKSVSHTRTGEDIQTEGAFDTKEQHKLKKANIKRMKKAGTYEADVKAQSKINKEYAAKQALAAESSSPATSKSPNKWAQFIPMALSALSSMKKDKDE